MKKNILALIGLTLLAGAAASRGNTHVWSGTQDGYWGNPANWSSGGAPSAFEAAPVVIQLPSTASARRQTTNNILSLKLDVLALYGGNYEMYDTAQGITLTGGQPPFPYGANLISGGSGTNYIDDFVRFSIATDISVLVGTNAALVLRASLTGLGGLTKIGSGTLNMSGSNPMGNDYSGLTTVLDGVLELNKYEACGWGFFCGLTAVPGALVVGDISATHSARVVVDFIGQISANCDLTINAGGAVELYDDQTVHSLTLAGGHLVFEPFDVWDEADQIYLTGYSEFVCGTNLTSYANHFSDSAVLGPGHFRFETTTNPEPTFLNIVGGTLHFEPGIYGHTPLNKIGDGQLVFAGGDFHDGDWIVQKGILVATGQAFFSQTDHSLVVSNGAQLSMRGACVADLPLHLNGFGIGGTNGAIVVEHDGATFNSLVQLDSDTAIVVTNAADTVTLGKYYVSTVYPLLSGPGSLTKKGPGTLKLTSNQTNGMTSPFIVDQGTLSLNLSQNLAAVSSPLIIGHNVADGTTAEVKCLSHNQILTSVPITINDSGTLNVYSTYQAVGPLTLQGGNIETSTGRLTLSADVLATNSLGSSISGNLSLGVAKRTFHLAPGYGVYISAQISDNGPGVGFDLDGGGTLLLYSSNILTGPINVKTGVLYARHDYALGNGPGGTTIANGARLAIDGRNLGAEPITLNGDGNFYGALSCAKTNTCSGLITLASDAAINVVSPTDRLTFSGAVKGPKGLTTIGYGTLALSGSQPNTYGGITTVAEGALELSKPNQIAVPGALVIGDNVSSPGSHFVHLIFGNQIAATAPVTVNSSGLFDMTIGFGIAQTIASLSGSGQVDLGSSVLTVGGNNANTLFSGPFTGFANSSLVKQGTGTLTLSSFSPGWVGSTVVGSGTLSVNGSQPISPVFVNPGATLAGNGVTGTISANNGKITPGNSPGLLKSGAFTLNPTSILEVELNGTNAGISYDQVIVTGTVSLGGAILNPLLGFNSAVSNKFVIIANDGIDPVIGTFNGLPEGSTFVAGSANFQITYKGGDGNDVVLNQISAITSPSFTGLTKLGNGQIELAGNGLTGLTYTIQANTDLATTNWIAIGTAIADQNGALTFADTNAPNYSIRFYRFVAP